MKLSISIDKKAGVCGGVGRATKMIEKDLTNKSSKDIYVNGELLHNRLEMERLIDKGLKVEEDVRKIKNSVLFFRAHGVGKDIKKIAELGNNKIMDATCPKVLRSQKIIEEYYQQDRQIIIIGKLKHPEVKGLLGHCENKGICVMEEEDLKKINYQKKSLLIAQTTVATKIYQKFQKLLKEKISDLIIADTICSFVENREIELASFAKNHSIIVFIGGSNSSNTKVMFQKIKKENPRSYLIENIAEIKREWFAEDDSVGISGSASTPMWQLEDVKKRIINLTS